MDTRLRVHKTGHQIADTVAQAFEGGNYAFDADLVYGILRHNIFSGSDNWFEVDRGYWGANHFDGTYRISYKGTQAKWHDDIPKQDIEFKLEDWKENNGYILICPPSSHVIDFFKLKRYDGLLETQWEIDVTRLVQALGRGAIRRTKESKSPIDWDKVEGVITFNSSVGWQALQRGIPVYSDPEHSIIGSYYKAKMQNSIDFLSDGYKAIDREPLFRAMRAHQFTLKEISEGKAWPLLTHYLSTSASTQEKLQQVKSPPTP